MHDWSILDNKKSSLKPLTLAASLAFNDVHFSKINMWNEIAGRELSYEREVGERGNQRVSPQAHHM
jgi:hypothetical protein